MTPTERDWRAGLEAVLTDVSPPSLVLQPIVDLRRGTIVGHEVLARFPGPPTATPDRWFAAAERLGCGPVLSRVVLAQALELLPDLPADTFLTVNLEPGHVGDVDLQAMLLGVGRLDRLVIELTEHAAIDDHHGLLRGLEVLRSAGARTAIDDAGSGYAGLQALLRLRPDFVKLDRSLVEHLDLDPSKRVLLRALGEIADGIDAWVLGEGIETRGELDELVAAGVPLGQGYLLGRPAATFATEIPVEVARAAMDRIALLERSTLLAALTEQPTERVGDVLVFDRDLALEMDELRRPVALLQTGRIREDALLLAKAAEPIREVARRIVTRPARTWSDPVVVTDGRGTVVGVVRVVRILEHLASKTPQPAAEAAG
ncbi:MAG TPA: EAL domain-containing protein [Egicoccus sp.]|nr:EAL domain-containing protein [Egicoccus sp.]HSK25239.1 EAL domain-containing protein [Egicoccus sp.]